MPRLTRTLLFSTLFPSAARPVHGIFVETRLRELLKSGHVETRVVSPVPWFPGKSRIFGGYAAFAATPREETRHGVAVLHPRYLLPPRIGMTIAPYTLARAAIPVVRKLIRDGFEPDLIDAHYYYPDGVAASMIAEAIGKPFVVTARGTDLNLIAQFPRPRRLILETAARAKASIGVCKALMDTLAHMGADTAKLHVFRNGVDLDRFTPIDREQARERLGFVGSTRRILLSVGLLIERKGHDIAIAALPLLPTDTSLVIVGSGPERESLDRLARKLGVADRVRFAGQIPNAELKTWYSAADVLLLCSSREGWANVLLESMACGTPVVATNIWGTPEVVATREIGRLMAERTPAALVNALQDLMQSYPNRTDVRKYAERFSWQETTDAQLALFREIVDA